MKNWHILILFILFALIVSLLVAYASGNEEDLPLGAPIKIKPPVETITILNKPYTLEEYAILKVDIKSKIGTKTKPTWNEKELWIEVVNRELPTCRLEKVTSDNIIEKLNSCL